MAAMVRLGDAASIAARRASAANRNADSLTMIAEIQAEGFES